MEDERADFYKSFNGIVAKFGAQVCPVVVPVISGGKVVAYYNMIDGKAYEYDGVKRKESSLTHDDEPRFEAIKAVLPRLSLQLMKNLWKSILMVKN